MTYQHHFLYKWMCVIKVDIYPNTVPRAATFTMLCIGLASGEIDSVEKMWNLHERTSKNTPMESSSVKHFTLTHQRKESTVQFGSVSSSNPAIDFTGAAGGGGEGLSVGVLAGWVAWAVHGASAASPPGVMTPVWSWHLGTDGGGGRDPTAWLTPGWWRLS